VVSQRFSSRSSSASSGVRVPILRSKGRPWKLAFEDRVLLVAAYWRTNLTMRQLAALFGTSKSAADRTIDDLGPKLALRPRKGESFEATAERALRGSVDGVLDGRTDIEVTPVVEMGYPPKGLVEHSKTADLLVVGSRGRGGLAGTLLGSVSLHCVSLSGCPVVVIRTEK
jgi:nucleotide-binding universal stress UspA family protein